MKLSVIVPSRLQKNPAARPEAGDLYLDRSLMSVKRNADEAGIDLEFLIGLDKDAGQLPARFTRCFADAPVPSRAQCELEGGHAERMHSCGNETWPVLPGLRPVLKVAYSDGTGQSQAVNAAAKLMTGDVVAMIEDDDAWRPGKLAIQLDVLTKGYAFCSTTQRESDQDGNFRGTNAFACPSTWVMPRDTWDAVGPFDETFRWHVDTEWLGRLNRVCKERGWKRAHIAHTGAERDGSWLANVARFSDIGHDDEIMEPLVDRTVNEQGGMAAIRMDAERLKAEFRASRSPAEFRSADEAQAAWRAFVASQDSPAGESEREHGRMFERWGMIPW